METPEPLLKVLRRKLAEQSPLLPSATATASTPSSAQPAKPPKAPAPPPLKSEPQRPTASVGAKASQETPAPKGSLVVQVAAFSVEASARKVAEKLGGLVTRPGKYWLVRLGPFTNSAQAAPALEKARAAGYRDARIQRAD
jgi:rare lipoprotein A